MEFEDRLEAMREENENNRKESGGTYCQTCKKHFSSVKAYSQHEKSQRHLVQREGGKAHGPLESTKPFPLVSNNGNMFIAPGTCLLDGLAFEDVTTCLRHMAVLHNFRIPFWDSLEDLEGLLTYLGRKVGEYTCCIFCDKKFPTLQSLRDHMSSKNHCRMKDNDEAWLDEFSEFYSFKNEVTGNPLVPIFGDFSENEDKDPQTEAYELCLPRYRVGHRAFALYYRQRPRRERPYAAALLNGQLRNELEDSNKYLRKLSENVSNSYASQRKKFELSMGLKNNYIKKLQQRKHISALNSGY